MGRLSPRLSALPLRQKLVVLVFTVSSVACILGFSLYALRDLQALRQALIGNAHMVAGMVANYSAADLAFGDTRAAQETLSALHGTPFVVDAVLLDRDQQLFASLNPAAHLKGRLQPETEPDRYFHITAPVQHQNKLYGQLHLTISKQPLREGLYDALYTLAFILGFVLILSLLLAFRLQRYVSQPIIDLTRAAQQVSADADYSKRLPLGTQDEIGSLYRAFNDMLGHIQAREQERDAANRAQEVSASQVRLLLNSTAEAIYGADLEGICTFVNPACLRMLGYRQESDLVGTRIHERIHHHYPDGRPYPSAQCAIRIATQAGLSAHRDDEVHWRADGSSFPVEYWSHPMFENGVLVGTVVTFVDVTERKRAEADLLRFRAALDSSVDAIYLIERHTMRFIDANRAGWESVGYRREELLQLGPQHLQTDLARADLERLFDKTLAGANGVSVLHATLSRKDGSQFPVEVILQRLAEQARPAHAGGTIVAVARDISERKRNEAELHRMAYFDGLTKLPNRLLFNDRLRQAIADAKRRGRLVALMLLDLDHFKTVNDTLGHEAGDAMLREIAQRLRCGVRAVDTIARLGGDEFALIFPDLIHADDAAPMAQNILQRLAVPIDIEGREVFSSASIGITLFPADTEEPDALTKYADSAMYHAKGQGRNNYQFYSNDMTQSAQRRLMLETALRHAIARNELFLVYQPQVAIASGRITGVEALLRWRNPQGDVVPPAQFIPLAEESGLIVSIGAWVLEQACLQLQRWHAAGHAHLAVSVNVAARQFREPQFGETVRAAIAKSGIAPQRLELEITEGLLLENKEEIRCLLDELKTTDIMLAIDDFGTGYSSLSYLKRFPIDRVKIDQSFVRDLNNDADDLAIVKAIIALARALKLKVIAEGVETAEQLDLLRSEGCDEYQGYYFGRPMEADAIGRLLDLQSV